MLLVFDEGRELSTSDLIGHSKGSIPEIINHVMSDFGQNPPLNQDPGFSELPTLKNRGVEPQKTQGLKWFAVRKIGSSRDHRNDHHESDECGSPPSNPCDLRERSSHAHSLVRACDPLRDRSRSGLMCTDWDWMLKFQECALALNFLPNEVSHYEGNPHDPNV